MLVSDRRSLQQQKLPLTDLNAGAHHFAKVPFFTPLFMLHWRK
jgi:hypothetical protein